MYSSDRYLYQNETYVLIGIAMEIHQILGKGFAEVVYKDAFEYELKQRGIPYTREKEYKVHYKDIILPHLFYADFVINDSIILELKSKSGIIDSHMAQVLNYLAISKLRVDLIVNFHESLLEKRRVVL